MRLYLIRHGQTEWNKSGRAQGHADVDLDDKGYQQANHIADALENSRISRIYSSDLTRCILTSEPLSQRLDLQPRLREDLRERCFGELEGAHYTEIRAWFTAECREHGLEEHEMRPEGGESLRDVWRRLDKFQKELERYDDNVAVFTHGGTCGLLLARLICGEAKTARSFRFENGSITELIRRPDGLWQLLRFTDTAHLEQKVEGKVP